MLEAQRSPKLTEFSSSLFTMSSDEFDEYGDEYDGLDFDAIPDLNDLNPPPPIPEASSSLPERPASSTSSHYSFDDLDQSLLVELDKIESRLIENATESTNGALSGIVRVQTLHLYSSDAWLRRCGILEWEPQWISERRCCFISPSCTGFPWSSYGRKHERYCTTLAKLTEPASKSLNI